MQAITCCSTWQPFSLPRCRTKSLASHKWCLSSDIKLHVYVVHFPLNNPLRLLRMRFPSASFAQRVGFNLIYVHVAITSHRSQGISAVSYRLQGISAISLARHLVVSLTRSPFPLPFFTVVWVQRPLSSKVAIGSTGPLESYRIECIVSRSLNYRTEMIQL